MVSVPKSCKFSIMFLESSRITSDNPIKPTTLSFKATIIEALPSCFNWFSSASTLKSILFSDKNLEFPAYT